jgi:ParB-like chromosome segregation protein Spo0J
MTPRTRTAPPADAAPPAPTYAMAAVAELIPYARNARTHTPQQVQQIAASIREFGFLAPVITDGARGILAGHGRILAAQLLKLTEVPVIEAAHLSEAQRRAYVLADNRIALSAGWDDDLLRVEIADLRALDYDVSLTGFSAEEIDAMTRDLGGFAPGGEGDQGRRDELSPLAVTCPECGHAFNAHENHA